jgi:hypothetical protein
MRVIALSSVREYYPLLLDFLLLNAVLVYGASGPARDGEKIR